MSLFVATLQEVRELLGLLSSNTKEDAQLQVWLETLQGRMEAYCRRGFEFAEDVEEVFDGDVFSLNLYRFPVKAVSGVHVNHGRAWEALAPEDYLLRRPRGRLYYRRGYGRWPSGVGNIRVVYSGGLFGAGNTGCDWERGTLRRAFLLQARYEWKHRDSLGVAGLDANGASVGTTEAALLPDARSALDELARVL